MVTETNAARTDGGGRFARVRLLAAPRFESLDAALLLGVTLLLVAIGLIMVLSSSSVEEFAAGNGISSKFIKQLIFAVVGIPVMITASRIPIRIWLRVSYPMLGLAMVLQALVFTPLGYEVNGNRSWLAFGPISVQPAEFAKVALCVWLGMMIQRKGARLDDWKHLILPIGLPVGVVLGLALAGKDLGTVLVMGALVLGGLWFGGVRLRYLAVAALVAVGVAVLMAAISPNRVSRITSFFSGTCDYEGLCWQTAHGFYALARGGLFGVGLGNSTAKWSWLPEADNDFIFAITGEEFGMLGAVFIIALFIVMAVALLRIVRATPSTASKVVVGSLMSWLMFQTFVNIAVVLGLLPVLGVPLPLMSSGGSALITTLLAIGIVLSIARDETTAAAPAAPGRPTAARRSPGSASGGRSSRPSTGRTTSKKDSRR